MWTLDITENGSTAYQAIVDALERDVAIGRLKPGEKLPTHRALAAALGLAVGTVSRAYAEAKRRGIVASGVVVMSNSDRRHSRGRDHSSRQQAAASR